MDKLKKLFSSLSNAVRGIDGSDFAYGLGVVLVGVGAGGYDWRAGCLLSGLLLVYTVISAASGRSR